jgi:hypothetical protein
MPKMDEIIVGVSDGYWKPLVNYLYGRRHSELSSILNQKMKARIYQKFGRLANLILPANQFYFCALSGARGSPANPIKSLYFLIGA